VIKAVYRLLSQDEARHGGAYLRYMKKYLGEVGDQARAAFAKIGVLMASARRTDKALHPTNLHVNQSLFPNDTVQSRLPDPGWLERWLDEQIRFDKEWRPRSSRGSCTTCRCCSSAPSIRPGSESVSQGDCRTPAVGGAARSRPERARRSEALAPARGDARSAKGARWARAAAPKRLSPERTARRVVQ